MDRITTTMTIADLHHENILTMDTIDKQTVNNARNRTIPATTTREGAELLILPLIHSFFHP